jgi:DNA-directed RNA polymerase specialized sigma24 family protein
MEQNPLVRARILQARMRAERTQDRPERGADAASELAPRRRARVGWKVRASSLRIVSCMKESQLLERARAGDRAALDELFTFGWPLAWHWAYGVTGDRMLADHVAQDALVAAFRALDRFDPQRPFRPWLKRITVNLAIDEVRRERKHDPARWSELRQVDAFAEGDALDEVVDAVLAGFADGEKACSTNGRTITVRCLVTAMRHAARSLEIA